MFGRGGLKQVAGKLLDTPAMDHLTLVIASCENELLRAAEALDAAHGHGHIDNIPAVEDRQAALKELVRALITESFDTVWLEEIAPDLLDKPERAGEYLGMDADAWDGQKERWADAYREAAPDAWDTDDLADHHVSETFGVDLATFEDRVVRWNAGEEAERLFAGNFRACVTAMREAADAAGEGDE